MSKKTVEEVEKQNRTKKRRGCCVQSCLGLLIFNFVLSCIIVCVGFVAGDIFSRQRLGMSLIETFGVVKGVMRSNGDVVDNAYDENDEAAFYDSMGGVFMLKNGVVKSEDIKSAIVNALNSDDSFGSSLADYASDIFYDQNFDQNKINNIGTTYNEAYNLKISDKQLAAFINGIVNDFLQESVMSNSQDFGNGIDIEKIDFKSFLKLEQIKLYEKNGEDMLNGIVSLNIDNVLNEVMGAIDVDAFTGGRYTGFARFGVNAAFSVIKSILPSKFYIGIDMGLTGSVEPTLRINNMDKENMDRLYRLLDTAKIKIGDGNKGFKEQFNDLFIGQNSEIKNKLEELKVGEFVEAGGINCNIYQLIIDAAKFNYEKDENGDSVLKDPSKCIEAIDILQTLKFVLSDENDEYLESLKSNEHTYKNVKFKRNDDGSLDLSSGEPIIEEIDPKYYSAEVKPELLDAYEKLILSEFSKNYGLKNDYTLKQVVDNFSDSFDKNEAVKMFDAQKVKDIIGKDSVSGVALDDKMLAALFMRMTDGEQFRDILGAEYIYIDEVTYQDKVHSIMHVGLDANVNAFIDKITENETVSKVLGNLLPERFVAEAAFDITLDTDDYMPIEILLFGKDIDVINKLLISFGALKDDNGEVMTLGEYFDSHLETLRTVIHNMGDTLPGLKITPSGLELPDVYVALDKMMNGSKSEDDEGYIQPDMIESSLKLLTYEGIFTEGKYAAFANDNAVRAFNDKSDKALLKEIKDKYGIADANDSGEDFTLSEILHVLNVVKLENPGKVEGLEIYDILDSDKFTELTCAQSDWHKNLKANIRNTPYIDTSAESDSDMFTAFIKQIVSVGDINYGPLGDFDIDDLLFAELSKENDKQYLILNIRAVVKDIIPSGEQDEVRSFVEELLPSLPSLVQIKIDITSAQSSDHAIFLNDNQSASDSLFTMLENLGMEIDLSKMCDSVRDEFFKIKEQDIDFEIGERSLLLPNVFEMIDTTVLKEGYNDGGEKVKSAFEGIFRTSESKIDKFEQDTVVNPINSETLSVEQLIGKVVSGGVSDREFGAYIKGELEDKVGTLLELNFLTKNPTSQKNRGDRQKLNGLNYSTDDGKIYMVLTVRVDLDKFNSADNTDEMAEDLKKLLPKEMLTTFVLEFDAANGKFHYDNFIINGMSKDTRDVLLNLIDVESAVANLQELADKCVEPVNNLLELISGRMVVNGRHTFVEDTTQATSRGKYIWEF